MMAYDCIFGKEVGLGAGFDVEGDVQCCNIELIELVVTKVGFDSLELGPVTSNQRLDNAYKPGNLTLTGSSISGFLSAKSHSDNKSKKRPRRLSVAVHPSFGLINLPVE